MINRKASLRLSATVTCLLLLSANSSVQAQSVLTGGLQSPAKIVFTEGGHLLVAESGRGINTGRVSRVDRCGNRVTMLEGLPAGIAAENSNSGPTAVAVRGNTLFIAIGAGDAVVAGPRPGTEVANPNGPSSPLFSSVLQVDFAGAAEHSAGGFRLTPADHTALKSGAPVTLRNAQGEAVTIKLLADFPDFVADPFTIARPSNPFALALLDDQLFVADASFNALHRINLNTGATDTPTRFAPQPNPLPFGGPVFEAVPDGLRVWNDQLLVTFLTGFPFPNGRAEVRAVTPGASGGATLIGGLTTAIDVLAAKTRLGADQFYVLEFSANFLQGAPGRLLRFDSPSGAPTVIASGLIGATGLARDPRTGDIFIAELFTGLIKQINGTEFDICLQDDDTRDVLRFNSLTGDYLFVSCQSGLTMSGRGKITRTGCQIELQDARVAATLDRCPIAPSNRASALVRRTPLGPHIFINDSNTTDNNCTRP